MSKQRQIEMVINVRETHSCGQVLEQAMRLKNNPAFLFEIEQKLPDFAKVLSEFALLPENPRMLKAIGEIEQVDISGVEWRDRGLFCAGCGANLLEPGESE